MKSVFQVDGATNIKMLRKEPGDVLRTSRRPEWLELAWDERR